MPVDPLANIVGKNRVRGMDGATVYLLLCSDRSYYCGITRNELATRVSEHNSGKFPGYTWNRRPVLLVWSEHFLNITDAIACERRIKGWSRAKKEALIRGDWAALQDLAIAYRDRSPSR